MRSVMPSVDYRRRKISVSEDCIQERKKRDILQALSFFQEFSEDETLLVLKITDWIKIQGGELIIKEGSVERMFFLILKGSVAIKKNTGVGSSKRIINRLTAGQSFGEMSFITSRPRSADVVAEEETFVLRFDAEVLDQQQGNPQFASILNKFYKKFSQILAERLADVSRELANPCCRLY